MAYEKHTWETGETITAEKLNNLEDGIQEVAEHKEIFIVNVDIDMNATPAATPYLTTADKTFTEIKEAYEAGKIIKIYAVSTFSNPVQGQYIIELVVTIVELNENISFSGTFFAPWEMTQPIFDIRAIQVIITNQGVSYLLTTKQFT